MSYDELSTASTGPSTAEIRERVVAARRIQADRYTGSRFRTNSDLRAEVLSILN